MGANLRASCCQVASSRFIWFGSSRYDPQVAKSMMFVRCPKGQFTFFSGESTPIFLMWDWGTSNGSYDINHLHRYKPYLQRHNRLQAIFFGPQKPQKKTSGKLAPATGWCPYFSWLRWRRSFCRLDVWGVVRVSENEINHPKRIS